MRLRRRHCVTLALALLTGLHPLESHADSPETPLSREAGDHLLHGHVEAVLQLFVRAAVARNKPSGSSEIALDRPAWTSTEAGVLAEALMAVGRYPEARKVLTPHVSGKAADPQRILQLVEIERLSGTAPDRLRVLMKALQARPLHPQLLVAAGEVLYETGKAVQARKLLDPLADRFEAEEFKEPLDLLAVAQSLALNGFVRDANRVFEQAEEAATDDRERKIIVTRWGQLFLSKYNWRDADASFAKVLAIDPESADAVAGMARVDLESDHDIAKAKRRLDAALARNPQHPGLLTLRAEAALADEDLPVARGLLKRALQERADLPDALRVQGATCKLADDEGCWKDAEKAALRINGEDGRLYLVAAQWLEVNHRYREVLELLKQALLRQPDLWQAHAALGMAYARIADDTKAKKELETAFAGDPFDTRTVNQLKVLYDQGGVLRQMVLLPGEHVDLRVHRKDRKALERTMLPFLQTAWQGLVQKYGFSPDRPLQVEIFPEVEQFSVRTVGLPQLGAHAVCFGHLITSRSPVDKPFNWKMVLQHELSHVFHIQASDGRVPRWLTEGLAMMESAWADPRWKVHLERRAYGRWKAGRMAPIERFNLAFSQATSMQDIVDAYYQAALLVEYLDGKYGFPKLRNLVAGFKTGRATPQLVQEHLGTTPQALDREFSAWLGTRLAAYAHDFHPTVADLVRSMGLPEGTAEDEAPVATAPVAERSSVRATLVTALQSLRAGRTTQAAQLLRDAITVANLAGAPPQDQLDQCTVRYLLMDLAVQSGDRDEAGKHAEVLVQVPGGLCDGVTQRLVLMAQARRHDKRAEAVQHLRRALTLDPEDGMALTAAAEVAAVAYQQLEAERKGVKPAGNDDWLGAVSPQRKSAEIRAMVRRVVASEPNDPRPGTLLAKMAWNDWRAGGTDAVPDLQLAAAAIEETEPAGRQAVLTEARLFVARGKPEAALLPYRLAAERAQTREERAEVWCELAEIATKADRPEDAAEAGRHCAVDRPPEPQTDRTAPKTAPQPPGKP
jgi:tetratricopeptide (TPR) repeat protein